MDERRTTSCGLQRGRAITGLVSSQERQRIVLDAGHLGLLVGPFARRVTWPAVQDWLEPYSR